VFYCVHAQKFQEHFNQAQLLYNSLSPNEKCHLTAAISFELSHCDDPVVYKSYTKVLNNTDFDLAKQVDHCRRECSEMATRANSGRVSKALSQQYYIPKEPTIASRRIVIIGADGFCVTDLLAIRTVLASAGTTNFVIGPGFIRDALKLPIVKVFASSSSSDDVVTL
jgi:catalase